MTRSFVSAVVAIGLGGALVAARVAGAFDVEIGVVEVTSTAFADSQPLPARFTCDGEGVSPPISWTEIPAETKSLVLVMEEETSGHVHWLVYDIAPVRTGFGFDTAPADARVGLNDAGRRRYEAPCSYTRQPMNYVFSIYALDRRLELDAADAASIRRAMINHVLARGTMLGTHERRSPGEIALYP